MTYPAAHGSGGFAFRHEAKAEDKPVRIVRELHYWKPNRFLDASAYVPPLRYRNHVMELWYDCLALYWCKHRQIIRLATGIRVS